MVEREDYRESVVSREVSVDANAPKSEYIRRDIETTRAALDEKLDALQTKVRDVQTKAKQTFDLNYQVDQHPWAMFAGSIGTGFALGLMFGNGHHEEHHWHTRPGTMYEPQAAMMGSQDWGRRDSGRGDIFDTLKLAAGAALTDLVRQSIKRYVPALGNQLDQIWNERGLTPTSIASKFINTGRGQQHPQAQSGSAGMAYGQGSGGYYGSTGGEQMSGSYGTSGGEQYGSTHPVGDMRQDYNPTMQTPSEPAVRGEVTTRS